MSGRGFPGPHCLGRKCRYYQSRKLSDDCGCNYDAIHADGLPSRIAAAEVALGLTKSPTVEEWELINDMPCPCYREGERVEKKPGAIPWMNKVYVEPTRRNERLNWQMAQSMQDQGATRSEIARAMGCQPSSVTEWLKRTKQTPNPRKPGNPEGKHGTESYDYTGVAQMAADGMTRAEIARKKDIPYKTLCSWMLRNGFSSGDARKAPKKIDDATARDLYEQGLSDPKMAKILGCSPNGVLHWRQRNKLQRNAEPQNRKKA